MYVRLRLVATYLCQIEVAEVKLTSRLSTPGMMTLSVAADITGVLYSDLTTSHTLTGFESRTIDIIGQITQHAESR